MATLRKSDIHSDFSLVLSNISMHHFDILLNLITEQEGISICFGLRENDCLSTLTVDDQNVRQS